MKVINSVSSDNITDLEENEIFVFGSNEAGYHGKGAARLAYEKFGAVWNKGVGLMGKSYAIPTKSETIETLPITKIFEYVSQFIVFAREHQELTFKVTEIGCGLAGLQPSEVATMFLAAVGCKNIHLPKRFISILERVGLP